MNNFNLEKIKRIKFNIIHERGGITFHPLASPSLFKIFSKGIEKVVPGKDYDPMLVIFNDEKTTVLMPTDKCKSIGLEALEILKKDPEIIKKYKIRFKKQSKKFIDYMIKISEKFSNASDKEIIKYYKEYVKQYYDTCILGEPFPFAVRHELGRYLEKVLKLKINDNKVILDYHTILTTPTELSFINREEMQLNQTIKEIRDDKAAYDMFSKDTENIIKSLPKFKDISKDIIKHQKEFFWVPHDYVGNIWEVKDIISKIKDGLKREKLQLKEEDFVHELKSKQKDLFKKLLDDKTITEYDKEMFIAAQDAIMLIDLKKEMLSQVHYYINNMIKEVARRKKADFWNLIFLLETEFEDFLDDKIKEEILKSRKKSSTYICTDYHVYCVGEKETKEIISSCVEKADTEMIEISGTAASPGNIIGRVVVLNSPKELSKVKPGDIIVTGMTTPEYVPVMKKAGAIITDEGGITSHAAIVSRELGIPCIIGTKIATKVLKDGNIVEIHGSTGVIKILNR